MISKNTIPLYRPSAIVLAMLSLSIGWGIRGNFGHEFGAMLPGALTAIAICLLSGRVDWHRRVLFFGLFGAIGWAFGGSMSYMQIVSYSQSGHALSQLYGYFGVFVLGFLWSALGGAGTAYPAVENRERLTAIFKPMIVVFVLWAVYYFIQDHRDDLYKMLVRSSDSGDLRWSRQRSPFYWLDGDWVQAFLALVGVCIYDFCNRWFGKDQKKKDDQAWKEVLALVALPVVCALGAWVFQTILTQTGLMDHILAFIVMPQGDMTAPMIDNGGKLLQFDPPLTNADLVYNWPILFFDIGSRLGLVLGALGGIAVYFALFGKFRSGSSLILSMALGWFVAFLLMPVLLSPFFPGIGGFRMTPPRGDNWAGVVGVWVGLLIWMRRNGLGAVNRTSLICGLLGGLGYMTIQFIKVMLMSLGNKATTEDPTILQYWAHWQSANWHSIIMEQGAGLFFGLGLVIAMGILSTRTPRVTDEPPVRRWTEAFSVFFLLNVLLYVNMVKMVGDFTSEQSGGYCCVPLDMKMPLIQSIHFSAWGWFSIMYLLLSVCTVSLLAIHLRRPLLVVPSTWSGKGMFVYLIFLWAITLGNFMKAIPGFSEQRLATEGVIFVNALIVTFLIVAFGGVVQSLPERSWRPLWSTLVTFCLAAMLVGGFVYTGVARHVYHGVAVGGNSPMNNMRFGDRADWYVKPVLKRAEHR